MLAGVEGGFKFQDILNKFDVVFMCKLPKVRGSMAESTLWETFQTFIGSLIKESTS